MFVCWLDEGSVLGIWEFWAKMCQMTGAAFGCFLLGLCKYIYVIRSEGRSGFGMSFCLADSEDGNPTQPILIPKNVYLF